MVYYVKSMTVAASILIWNTSNIELHSIIINLNIYNSKQA